MKNLLAIIQEPAKSKQYLKYIVEFAKDYSSDLSILYVYPSEKYSHSADLVSAQSIDINVDIFEEKNKSIEIIESNIEEIKKEINFDIKVSIFIETGKVFSIYKDFIKKNHFDLVFLKSNVHSGLLSTQISNAELIRKLDCPLFIIPEGYEYKKHSKIVYATDYKDADIKTIKELISLTKIFEPEITTLHITDSTDMHERAMKYGFKEVLIKDTNYSKIDIKVFKEEEGKDIGEFVDEIVTRLNSDVLVLLKENHNFFERIFKHSAAESIVKESHIPVWAFVKK